MMRQLEQADVQGKRVIVRVDWNVTLGKALQIVDDTRIVRTLPTIRWLITHGAKQIILLSHLGKPEGKVVPELSLRPIAQYASQLLGEEIEIGGTIQQTNELTGQVVMLENLRFWLGEVANDTEFAEQLASLGDVYVNEAFGESHRETASIVGVAKLLPSYGGLWLSEEVKTITKVRDQAVHPFVVIMGGAKVEDKIKLLEVLSQRADTILLGGKLANEYLERGMKTEGGAKIITPIDGMGVPYLDIGPKTREVFAEVIRQAKTIVWNGPMGKVEEPDYQAGTRTIYEAMRANEAALTMVGGGDTLSAIGKDEHLTMIDHVSTGGGAMLKLLEQGILPGIQVLES